MTIKENNNSASRVKQLLSNALQQDGNASVFATWVKVLFPKSEENIDHFEMVKILNALREEIKATRAEAEKLNLPMHLYDKYIDNALRATQVDNLNSAWQNYRQYINNELLLCLSFCAFIFQKDEFLFDEKDILTIEKLVNDLEKNLKEGNIDSLLKYFISEQIKTLRHSLNEYKVKGAKAFKSVYVVGMSQVIENEELIRDNKDKQEIHLLKQLWEKVKITTDKAEKFNKGIGTWKKIAETGKEIIGYLS